MAPLPKALELLESAIGYALACTAMVTPRLLTRPTPCAAWDLATLLDHVTDSVDVFHEAVVGDRVTAWESDPICRLHGRIVALLGATAAAGPTDRPVPIYDRELAASTVTVTGAIEITVHGWDIAVACGSGRPIPSSLAAVLVATAPLLVPAESRPGLFADPVPLPNPACPGDELIAFLGRHPSRGDSEASTWSA